MSLLLLGLGILLLHITPTQAMHHKSHRIHIPEEHKKSSFFENSTTASQWSKDNAWFLPIMKGVMKGQALHIRKLENHPNPWHTCYEVICENTWNHHCPPAGSPEGA
jgi:hypothetical protein